MTKIYKVIKQLEKIGYKFSLNGNKIKYKFMSNHDPDLEKAKKLLQKIKNNKSAAIKELKNRNIDCNKKMRAVNNLLKDASFDWFVVDSKLLNENILIIKNENVKIPNKYKKLESYTVHELKMLLQDADLDKQDLKELHNLRKMFDGTLILADMEAIKK